MRTAVGESRPMSVEASLAGDIISCGASGSIPSPVGGVILCNVLNSSRDASQCMHRRGGEGGRHAHYVINVRWFL